MAKESFSSKVFDVVNFIILFVFTASIIYPFVYMLSQSISDPFAVGLMKVKLWPIGFQTIAYGTVFKDPQILTAYWNSIVYTSISTVFAITFNGLAAYALSRSYFKGKGPLTFIFAVTMFFSGGMIPAYLNIKNLGLLDSIWAIVLPSVGMWNIMLMRTNFMQLPDSLVESAYIDGANDWYIFYKIIVPLSTAIIATIAVFAAVGQWNNYFGPLLYIQSSDKEPLTLLLRRILITNEVLQTAGAAVNEANQSDVVDPVMYNGMVQSLKMATVFVTIGPIVMVYPFAQKYFVKGVLVGSVKG